MSRNKLQIQFTGLALEPLEALLAESGFIMFHPLVDVLLAKFARRGESVGHGGAGFGGAKAGFRRRSLAPRALLLCSRVCAARRRASAARLTTSRVPRVRTRPPLIRLSGHQPSQEAQCVALFHRLMSRPISAMRVWAVSPSMPSMRVKSTPLMR